MVADRDTTVRVAYFFLFLFINTWRSATRCRHCYSTLTIPPEDKIGSHDKDPPSTPTSDGAGGPGLPVSKGTVNPRWGLKDVLEIRVVAAKTSSPSTVSHAALLVAVSNLV